MRYFSPLFNDSHYQVHQIVTVREFVSERCPRCDNGEFSQAGLSAEHVEVFLAFWRTDSEKVQSSMRGQTEGAESKLLTNTQEV